MVRSEYRRDMILLRPLEEGISGFCRIEAHAMRGSITYNVRTQREFGGRLLAVMLGRRNGVWQVALGGEIRSGALGQAGFYWELDPRSVNSLALDNYALVGVAVDGPDARLLLVGKQDRCGVVDWEAVERAVRELLAPDAAHETVQETAQPTGSTGEAGTDAEIELTSAPSTDDAYAPEPQAIQAQSAQPDAQATEHAAEQEQCPPADSAPSEPAEASATWSGQSEPQELSTDANSMEDTQAPDAQEDTTADAHCAHIVRVLGASIMGDKDTDLSDAQLEQLIERTVRDMLKRISDSGRAEQQPATSEPEQPDAAQSADAPSEADSLERAQTAPEQEKLAQPAPEPSSPEQPETDATQPAPIDEPSATPQTEPQPDIQAWLLEGMCAQDRAWPSNCAELKRLFENARRVYPLDMPGYVFVRAPLAGGGSCAVGVKCEDGRPSEVAYLIPGLRAAQPPAGLEGYTWREGEGGGFWVARQDAFTGNMLFE